MGFELELRPAVEFPEDPADLIPPWFVPAIR